MVPWWDGDDSHNGMGMVPMVGEGRCPQQDGNSAHGGMRTVPMVGQGWCPLWDGDGAHDGMRTVPAVGRGSPPACWEAAALHIPAACPGRFCLSIDRFFPARRAWLPLQSKHRSPERQHGQFAAAAALDTAPLAQPWPCLWLRPRMRLQLPRGSWGCAGGSPGRGRCWGSLGMPSPRGTREDAHGGAGDAATCGCPGGEAWG